MKKSKIILKSLLLMILAAAISFPLIAQAQTGEEEYAIVVSANASATEMYAAETLQEYLYYLNERVYEIITDDQPFNKFKFCIGATSVMIRLMILKTKPPIPMLLLRSVMAWPFSARVAAELSTEFIHSLKISAVINAMAGIPQW